MLAFFAAVVPIVASLYAGVSFLVDLERQRHVVRVYERIDAWYKPQREALGELLMKHDRRLGADRLINELNARKAMLLEANGVDPALGTMGHMNTLAAPAAVPVTELRRQWVLLIGSVVGVILLALDATQS